jgi:DNA polymerase/3'-5' exonuclease PolX
MQVRIINICQTRHFFTVKINRYGFFRDIKKEEEKLNFPSGGSVYPAETKKWRTKSIKEEKVEHRVN